MRGLPRLRIAGGLALACGVLAAALLLRGGGASAASAPRAEGALDQLPRVRREQALIEAERTAELRRLVPPRIDEEEESP